MEYRMIDQFDDIRPYFDHEVNPVLNRLISNPEILKALQAFQFKNYPKFLNPLLKLLIQKRLKHQFSQITSIQAFEDQMHEYLKVIVKNTTSLLNWINLDNLDPKQSYLFLTTHREILFDPSILNYILASNGFGTTLNAFGDNLLINSHMNDLMRLNKGFIVKRSAETRREKLYALKRLSQYITASLNADRSVWLAHREGRTKDGHDKTSSALLKMLSLANKDKSIHEVVEQLRIVPVSIAYEINPCDYLIAREMYLKETEGSYQKAFDEDVKSLVRGILEFKGRITLGFGKPISHFSDVPDIPTCLKMIDQELHKNYTLFPIHYVAYQQLYQQDITTLLKSANYSDADRKQGEQLLKERLALCDPGAEPWLLKQYANPVKNFIAVS